MNNRNSRRQLTSYGVRLIWPALALLLLLLTALPPAAFGQSSPITATVNHSQYTTDELVILTVAVVDNSPQQPRPILPPLDGLTVIDFDIATSVSMVNGQIQTEVIYTYELQPRRTGVLTIPPVTVKIDDELFKAPPLSISVSQGTAPVPSSGNAVPPKVILPPPGLDGQDFFVETVVDLPSPFVGQQTIYTFRFYQAIRLYNPPQYDMPIFNGFDTIGLPIQEYNLDIGDRTYLISEISTALFPKTAGTIRLGPARLAFPGNYFEEPLELYSNAARLEVKPLPDKPPVGFNGAVGQFQIEARFSPQVAVVNQPSTFSVIVSGSGNIHTLPEPSWPRLKEWRVYDSLASASTEIKDGRINGTRVYERLILSDKVGDFSIPPTKLVYFDPIAEEYRTISTKSLSGRIILAPTPDPAAATAMAIIALPTVTPASVNTSSDIGAPLDDRLVSRISSDSLDAIWRIVVPVGAVLFWVLCGVIPLAVVAGAGGFWLWQKRQLQVETGTSVLQQPSEKMHPTLAAALARNHNNFKAVSQALNSYLVSLLGTSVTGLTRLDLAHRLQQRGVSKALIARIEACLAQSEMGRFGPATNDEGWDLLGQTDELLIDLDKAIDA
ncbi:MAG: BatD family protein [Anaerolineae bacterium]|nr:BatD family protein [Anaerolineae bacterium]